MKKQVFGKGCMYANHMNPAVELRVGEGSPENEKIKNQRKILKKHAKNVLEKVMRKTWKFHEKGSQKESRNPLKIQKKRYKNDC